VQESKIHLLKAGVRALLRHPSLILIIPKGRHEVELQSSMKEERFLTMRYLEFLKTRPEPVAEISGVYFFLNPYDMYVSASIAVRKHIVFEPDVTKLFKRLLRKGSNVVDVGANVGWYTMLSARKAAHVWAFEPEPLNFHLLEKSKSKNGFTNVTLYPYCVSDKNGDAELSISDSKNRTTHSIVRDVGHEKVRVKSVTLDSMFPESVLDILKIDAEGAEPLIIQGAQKMIEEGRIANILMEWNPDDWKGNESLMKSFEVHATEGKILQTLPDRFCNIHLTPR